jgi:arabinan endo-1,5-alpha-L-arabinosidase
LFVGGGVAAGGLCFPPAALAQQNPPGIETTGDVAPVHDPAIIKAGDTWFLFTTGQAADKTGLLPMRTSTDLKNWTWRGPVFAEIPGWAQGAIKGTRGLWAPDISKTGGEYRLYYSVSTFGKNRSAIGLAVTAKLDPAAPGAGWTDRGAVFESDNGDNFNAIDPNIFDDAEGRQWMVLGSFWSGIKMIRLDPKTGMRSDEDRKVHALASRRSPGAVEAPFVIRRGDYYYLFVSFDFCCRGANSSYYTVVGRSKDPTGPYVDRDGRKMMEGGGLIVLHAELDPSKRFAGPGHPAILRESGRDHIVYHAYDTQARGVPTLRIQKLGWTEDGWPVAI